jgi:hypothetical protein
MLTYALHIHRRRDGNKNGESGKSAAHGVKEDKEEPPVAVLGRDYVRDDISLPFEVGARRKPAKFAGLGCAGVECNACSWYSPRSKLGKESS